MRNTNEIKEKIYEYIVKCSEDGLIPSIREIATAVKVKSTSTVHRHLAELEKSGFIQKGLKNNNRSIRLNRETFSSVPLLGTITAGQPILAMEHIEEYIPYAKKSDGDHFALRVKGESMIDIGILDKDIIVAQKRDYASNGEIVVALVEDEATVKRYFAENGHFRLQPENSSMEPMFFDNVTILGRVVSVIRYY